MLRPDRNPWWGPTHQQWLGGSDDAWTDLPGIGEAIEAVIHIGNGKDAYLIVELASGRAIELDTNGLRVQADVPLEIMTTAVDDLSLRVEYSGNDLVLVGGRMSFTGDIDDPETEPFLRDARDWIASGHKGALGYAVAVELRLDATSIASGQAAA